MITVPADALAADGARPSACTVLTGKINLFSFKYPWLSMIPFDLWGLDDVAPNSWQDLKKYYSTSSVNVCHCSYRVANLCLKILYSMLMILWFHKVWHHTKVCCLINSLRPEANDWYYKKMLKKPQNFHLIYMMLLNTHWNFASIC